MSQTTVTAKSRWSWAKGGEWEWGEQARWSVVRAEEAIIHSVHQKSLRPHSSMENATSVLSSGSLTWTLPSLSHHPPPSELTGDFGRWVGCKFRGPGFKQISLITENRLGGGNKEKKIIHDTKIEGEILERGWGTTPQTQEKPLLASWAGLTR